MQAKSAKNLPGRWEKPPPDLALGPGEVHLWRVRFDLPPAAGTKLARLLSEAEREKAGRFYFQEDRERYTVSKACQRAVLGAYLDVHPGSLEFDINPYGKPALRGEQEEPALQFNLSHSRRVGLLAVARGALLGVDVEQVRSREVDMGIARRFFSPQEVAELDGVPAADRKQAFFVCWTRKEAYIKARGEGLAFPLDKFSVSFTPDHPPGLLSNEIDPAETGRWDLYHLKPGPGYTGALVIQSGAWTIRQFEWSVQLGEGLFPAPL